MASNLGKALAALLGGGLDGYGAGQQMFQRRDQIAYDRSRDQAQDAQRQQALERAAQESRSDGRRRLIPYLQGADRDQALGAEAAEVGLGGGLKFRDPEAEAQNRQRFGQLLPKAFDYENPGAVADGLQEAERNGLPGPRPARPLHGPVMEGAPPLQDPGSPGGLAEIFKRGGRLREDVEAERKAKDAAALEGQRRDTRLEVARINARAAAERAQIQAGTAEDKAYQATYQSVFNAIRKDDPNGDSAYADTQARAAADRALGAFRNGETTPDAPAFADARPTIGGQRLELDKTKQVETARHNRATEGIATRGWDIRKTIAERSDQLNRDRLELDAAYKDKQIDQAAARLAIDQHKNALAAEAADFNRRLAVWKAQTTLAPEVKLRVDKLAGRALQLEKQINQAQAAEKPNWDLINRMSLGLQNLLDEQRDLTGADEPPGAAPGLPTPPATPTAGPAPAAPAPGAPLPRSSGKKLSPGWEKVLALSKVEQNYLSQGRARGYDENALREKFRANFGK